MPRDFRWFTVFLATDHLLDHRTDEPAMDASFNFHIPSGNRDASRSSNRHPIYSKARNKHLTHLRESLLPRRNSLKKKKEKKESKRLPNYASAQFRKSRVRGRREASARFFSRERRVIANRRYFGGEREEEEEVEVADGNVTAISRAIQPRIQYSTGKPVRCCGNTRSAEECHLPVLDLCITEYI